MQTPIVVGENLLCVRGQYGVLTCFDARAARSATASLATGARVSRPRRFRTGRHLFFASETGHVYVVPVDGKFSVAATIHVE